MDLLALKVTIAVVATALLIVMVLRGRRKRDRQRADANASVALAQPSRFLTVAGPFHDANGYGRVPDEIRLLPDDPTPCTFACGHTGCCTFDLELFGKKYPLSRERIAERTHCGDCARELLGKGIIRCALCGEAIRPGEPVAGYARSNDDGRFKEWKTVIRGGGDNDGTVIGCLGFECCPSGVFFIGHWHGDGVQIAFNHGGTILQQVLATGKPVIGTIGPDGVTLQVLDDEK